MALNRVLPKLVDDPPNVENGVCAVLGGDGNCRTSMLHRVSCATAILYPTTKAVRCKLHTRRIPGGIKSAGAVEMMIPLMRLCFAGKFNKIVTEDKSHTLTLANVQGEYVQNRFVAVDNLARCWQPSLPQDSLLYHRFRFIQQSPGFASGVEGFTNLGNDLLARGVFW